MTRVPEKIHPLDAESVYRARLGNELAENGHEHRVIDLFSGAGGLSLGFTESFGHSYELIWANDNEKFAVDTYNANFRAHCEYGNIVDLLDYGVEVPKADVVIGGPPCQGFSLLNRNRDGDPRKELWQPFLDIVERSEARVFLMENVPQLLSSDEYQLIVEKAESLGFEVFSERLCAADYGVPQVRWRGFIIGCLDADPRKVFPPLKSHYDPNKTRPTEINGYLPDAVPWLTVRDAISDLPPPKGTEIRDVKPPMNLHFGRNPTELSKKRYEAIPEEGMNRFDLQERAPQLTPQCWINKKSGGTDLFGRLWWDRPAFTVRTEFFKPEKGRYLHPEQHRPITHREAARFQSFPDSFRFTGSKIQIAKQIGNAVPPKLAARLADTVYALLLTRVNG